MPEPLKRFAVPIDLLGQAIRHLATPTNPDDAAPKSYADGVAAAAQTAAIAAITTQRAIPGGYATLDVDGKLSPTQLPALAITDTFVVATQVAQLALIAQRGDVAIRTDLGKSFILAVDDPTQLANWRELLATGYVLSIDGMTGVVHLSFQASIGNGVLTDFTLTHNLASRDVQVAVLDSTDVFADVECRVTRPDANSVRIEVAGTPPAAGVLRVIVQR